MASATLRSLSRLYDMYRTYEYGQVRAKMLLEMRHFPPHLLEDVNAKGFPADTEIPRLQQFNKTDTRYKIYSFD